MRSSFVITRTPLRVSLVGGGTDMPYFYEKYGGATFSMAINKYIYIVVKYHNNFKEKYRLNYSETEVVKKISEIKNVRVKESIKKLNIKKPLYINTFSDLPANSGLGSSSSFTVGLLKALIALSKKKYSNIEIAEMAYEIEKKISKKSLGKQDHYIASLGGINFIRYKKNNINYTPILLKEADEINLFNSLILFPVGDSRDANQILIDQRNKFKENILILKKFTSFAYKLKNIFKKKKLNILLISKIISYSWKLKKKLSEKISNSDIDKTYLQLIKKGFLGGKLLGAGSGGYFLMISPTNRKIKLQKSIKISLDKEGCVIL